MTIGERIKLIRKDNKQTQADFGKNIGLKATIIGQMENGTRNLTDRTALLICEKYNINEEWLRNGIEPMKKQNDETILSEVTAQYHLTDLDKAVIKIFLELPQEKRDVLKDFTFSLVDTVLNNDSLYTEYRKEYISENTLPLETHNETENVRSSNIHSENITVEEAEAAYIKSRLNAAKKTASSASSITEENNQENMSNKLVNE